LNTTAIHEAGHAVVGLRYGLRVDWVSLVPVDGARGRCHFDGDRSPDPGPLHCAAMFVAGQLAVRMMLGRPERANWLDEADSDIENALAILAVLPNPLLGRQIAELQERSALWTRWDQVRRLADALEQRKIISGEKVRELALGVKRIDPAKHLTIVNGRKHSLREVADALDVGGHQLDSKTHKPVGLRLLTPARTAGGRDVE
jgi:hypothetical protein